MTLFELCGSTVDVRSIVEVQFPEVILLANNLYAFTFQLVAKNHRNNLYFSDFIGCLKIVAKFSSTLALFVTFWNTKLGPFLLMFSRLSFVSHCSEIYSYYVYFAKIYLHLFNLVNKTTSVNDKSPLIYSYKNEECLDLSKKSHAGFTSSKSTFYEAFVVCDQFIQ